MGSNIQRLGTTLANRMKQTSRATARVTMELGAVNSDLSITTDSLQANIPKGEYMINLMLTDSGGRTSTESHTHNEGTHDGHAEGDGGHEHSGGDHSHQLPPAYRGLRAGDRILVAWCGNEPVVIAIVASS